MDKNKSAVCPFCQSTYTKYLKLKERYWCFDCNKYFHNEWLTAQDIRKLESDTYSIIKTGNEDGKGVYKETLISCPNCKSKHIQFSTAKMKYWCYECNMYF